MSDVFSSAGSLAYAVVGLAGLGVLAALGLAGLSFSKRRVPLTAWLLIPLLVLGIGAIGTWMNSGSVYTAIEAAQADSVPEMAMGGLWDAVALDWLSRWAAAFLLAVSAGCASVGAIAAGDDTRMTPIAGAMAGISTLLGAGICAGYAISHGIGGEAFYLVGVLLIGGIGVTIGSFRRALDEQAQRVAGMRFAASIAMLLAVSYGGRALVIGTEMQTFAPGGLASQAKDLAGAILVYNDLAAPAYTLGWIAFAAALAIAFFGFFYELGEVVERYTLVDVWGALAIMAVLGLVRVVEHGRTDNLMAVATNAPATEMFGELGADLAPALLTIEKESIEVHPGDGGFGDVLVLKKSEDGQTSSWVRAYKWTGTTWEPDETPLESVQLHPRRPLLAVSGSEEAALVMDILDKTPEGNALLLMRAGEVKNDVTVPLELSFLQVTFLELQKATERDLEKELWTSAGSRSYNWGPTAWFGEGQDDEPLAYAEAVGADSEAEGLHVVVEDEKPRIRDIANSCLPWLMKKDGEAISSVEGRWCRVTGDAAEDLRVASAEVWPLPEVEDASMSVRKLEGDQLEEELVVDRFQRELGGIDYCIDLLEEEGEEADGQLRLEVDITKKGRVGDMIIHERSRIQSQAIARCVAQRFRNVEFVMPEEPEEEEGTASDDEEKEKEPPPPLPKYEVVLDLR